MNEPNQSLLQYIEAILEQELNEANAMSSGNVVGYSLPLGMDTNPGHKILWSGDKEEPNPISDKLKTNK